MTGLTVERSAPNIAIFRRSFAAPPQQVYAAHVTSDLIRQWCTGPDGWVMSRCDCDPRPGGRIHYAWQQSATGAGFYLTGEFILLEPGHRIIHIERMHLPDVTPDNRVETLFLKDGAGTQMVMTMTLPDAATLEAMLATGMAAGMERSYQRLEKLDRAA